MVSVYLVSRAWVAEDRVEWKQVVCIKIKFNFFKLGWFVLRNRFVLG